MSSVAITFVQAFKTPEEVYKENRETLKMLLEEPIKEIGAYISKVPTDITDVIVKELEKLSKSILESYTMSVFESPYHKQWVEEKIKMFNSVLANMKQLIRILDVEFLYGNGIDKDTYSSIQSLIPAEFSSLREAIKKYVVMPSPAEKKEEKSQSVEVVQTKQEKAIKEEYIPTPSQTEKKEEKSKSLKATQEKREKENLEKLKEEIRKLLSKIKAFDDRFKEEEYLSEIEKADGYRLSLILEGLKAQYIKVREQSFYREEVKGLIKELERINTEEAKRLIEKGQELLAKDRISRAEYDAFYGEVWKALVKEAEKELMVAEQILSKLHEMGYTIISDEDSIKEGGIVEIQTPYGEDYLVKVKVENGKVGFKFVRLLDEERELSTYEKEKDTYTAKKWCEDFDKLREKLKEVGINLEVKARIEPEERGIDYEIRKREKRKSVREEKRGKLGEFKKTS